MTGHKKKTPGLHSRWHSSAHAQHNVTCHQCHAAAPGDPDAAMHSYLKEEFLSTLR